MRTILVLDDSEMITVLLRDFLTSHGYDVLVATTAEQGYKLIQKQAPDLILLDVQLPDIEGFEVCKMLRARPETRHIPIMMITATATQVTDKVKGFQSGADDYLTKPFDMAELLERVRALLKRNDLSRGPSKDSPPRPKSAVEPSRSPAVPPLPLPEAVSRILLAPESYPTDRPCPSVTLSFLIALQGLLAAGLLLAPAVSVKPLMVCLLSLLIWSFLVSVLVVSCSLYGVALNWKEGSRLLCLASLPILLKLLGGFVLGAFTSLSPFLFSAGPSLFVRGAPVWLDRLDLFEIWASVLLWMLLRKRSGSNDRTALLCTLAVWIASFGLLWAVSSLGGTL